MGPITGRFNTRIQTLVGVPAPTGRAQPALHTPDAPDRPSRSVGRPGSTVPSSITAPLASPTDSGSRLRPNHYAGRSHYAPARDVTDASVQLRTPLDSAQGGRSGPQPLNGAAGAAHGGVRPSGSSEPWANPLGIRMGERYVPVTVLRPGAMHFNRPSLRPVRYTPPVRETGSPYPGPQSGTSRPVTSPFNPTRIARTIGTVLPRPVSVQRTGHGLTVDQVPGDYPDPGVQGGWAL